MLKYRKTSIALFIIVTVMILIGTLYPSDRMHEINIWEYDKIGHVIMFLVWTYLYGIMVAVRKKARPSLLIVFIFGLSYGLLIEFLQFIFPTNRSPELYDFIADAIGSLIAVFGLKYTFKSMFSSSGDQPA